MTQLLTRTRRVLRDLRAGGLPTEPEVVVPTEALGAAAVVCPAGLGPDSVAYAFGASGDLLRPLAERFGVTVHTAPPPVPALPALLAQHGHGRVHILRLDVEGAEYRVIDELLATDLRPEQIVVAFNHRLLQVGPEPTRRAIRALRSAGYRTFAVSEGAHEVSFILAEPPRPADAALKIWMDPIELSQLTAILEATQPRRVLEWGCGGSTATLLARSPFIERYVSVEHHGGWAAKVRETVRDPRLELHHAAPDVPPPPDATPAQQEDWDARAEHDPALLATYVGLPATLGTHFDLILVDGRARCLCVAAGWELLEPGGVLVIHDAQRPEYHAALRRVGRPVFLTPWRQGQLCLVRKPR